MNRRTHIALALAFAAAPLTAQKIQPIPQVGTVESYSYASRISANTSQELVLVDQHTVRRAGASFLQLEFASVKLSEESVLEIESLVDGEKQTFEFDTWDPTVPHSLYFNGDAVKVSLYAGRGAQGDSFAIKSVAVGNKNIANPLTICGPTDDRRRSTDTRIARILIRRGSSVGVCTAWLISQNNCFATAGHCLANSPSLVTAQFNVPSSSSSGAIRNPSTTSQYKLDRHGRSRLPGWGHRKRLGCLHDHHQQLDAPSRGSRPAQLVPLLDGRDEQHDHRRSRRRYRCRQLHAADPRGSVEGPLGQHGPLPRGHARRQQR